MKTRMQNSWKQAVLFILLVCLAISGAAGVMAEGNDPLAPAPVVSSDGNITLTKQAERIGPDEWRVSVKANVKDITVEPPKLEVVFVLDTSPSMKECPEENVHGRGISYSHQHDAYCEPDCSIRYDWHMTNNGPCWQMDANGTYTYPQRLAVAKTAISNLAGSLPKGTTFHYMHFNATVSDPLPSLQNVVVGGNATKLTAGVTKALTLFNDPSRTQILVILTDGLSTDGYPTAEVQAFKDGGGVVFTVGFNVNDSSLAALAGNGGMYVHAGSEESLLGAFNQIGSKITSMVIDPMGTKVNFDIKELQGNSNLSTSGNIIYWTPDKDQTSMSGDVVDYQYTVKLNDKAEKTAGEHLDIDLNGTTTFRYGITTGTGANATTQMYELNFPIPSASYACSTMQVSWVDENGNALTVPDFVPTETESLVGADFEGADFKTDYRAITEKIEIPDGNGAYYQYVGTVYTANGTTLSSLDDVDPAAASAYTVTHQYKKMEPGELLLQATKELDGRTFKAEDEYMEFELKWVTSGAPLPAGATGGKYKINLVPAVGEQVSILDFGVLQFTQPGIYEYTLEETPPSGNKHRVNHDDTTFTLTVTVDENLNISTFIQATLDNVTKDADAIVFRNIYPTSSTLELNKSVTGAAADTGNFSFLITPADADETVNEIYRSDIQTWAGKNGYTFDAEQGGVVIPTGDIALTNGSGSWQQVLNAFPTGTYTITEVEDGVYRPAYQVGTGAASETPATFELMEDVPLAISISNT
ncbi:MAG: VWA domain-containing protein, partial [Clostridia bacterium]|nr:VWA domain-containing protein [Clostridia bacterium]